MRTLPECRANANLPTHGNKINGDYNLLFSKCNGYVWIVDTQFAVLLPAYEQTRENPARKLKNIFRMFSIAD